MTLIYSTRGVAHALLILSFLVPVAAAAADVVLAETAGSKVTTVDIQGDVLRMPLDARRANLAKPESVLQLANNLVIRREIAARAEAEGVADDPAVQASIRIARERALSDAWIAKLDATNKPTAIAVDNLARANYKSNPIRFDLPAETSARHILIKLDTPDAKPKAEAILAQLKAGADFATLAKERSEDPGSAIKGGDLGYFTQGTMVPPFEAALASLEKPGDLSGVVETQFGYHILKLEGRRPAGVRPYDEVKSVLQREVEARVVNDGRIAAIQKVQSTVKMNQDAIKEFAESNK